jgi:hypothetical protein
MNLFDRVEFGIPSKVNMTFDTTAGQSGVQNRSQTGRLTEHSPYQEELMRLSRLFVAPLIAGLCMVAASTRSEAQISISIGVAPVCPYGYYNYAPSSCAPFGYYGPQWFSGGVFLGAGPWFRGPQGFHGYVNTYYDPRFGYYGPFPVRGERPDWGRHRGWEHEFHGNEFREERHHDNGNHYGQYKDHGDHGNPHGYAHDNHGRGNVHEGKHGDDHGHGHGRDK